MTRLPNPAVSAVLVFIVFAGCSTYSSAPAAGSRSTSTGPSIYDTRVPASTPNLCATGIAAGNSGGIGCMPAAVQTEYISGIDTQVALNNRTSKSADEVLAGVKASNAAPTPTGRTVPKVGANTTLAMRGTAQFVPVAGSYQGLVEFVKAIRANDSYGITQLMNSTQVVLVERGTTALILVPESGQSDANRVRLTSGRFASEIVFVIPAWVT
jgi:hypothetical protein